MARALNSLNVPSRKDIEHLCARVAELTSITKKLSGEIEEVGEEVEEAAKPARKRLAQRRADDPARELRLPRRFHRGRRRREKVGIALAGGGPLGGIYEIGALVALQEALMGAEVTDFDVYVGVSSGAFVAAGLANGLSPREMHEMFILDASHSDPFEPGLLLRPAFAEFARRLVEAPALFDRLRSPISGAGRDAASLNPCMRLTRAIADTDCSTMRPSADYLARSVQPAGPHQRFP